MPPLTERDVRFWITWSAGHGVSLATVIWLAVYLTNGVRLNQLWIVGLVLFLGFVGTSIMQQVLLSGHGFSAWFWWLTSLLACVVLAAFGTYDEQMILAFVGRNDLFGEFELPLGPALAALFIGAVFGGVQLWGCAELRRQTRIWPIANALAFAAVIAILPFQRNYAIHVRIAAYLVAFVAGTAFGAITGYALVFARRPGQPIT